MAEELELDMDAFAACLEDPEMMDRVTSDLADGAAVRAGTPTFIILKEGDGSIVPGALPEESFAQIVRRVVGGDAQRVEGCPIVRPGLRPNLDRVRTEAVRPRLQPAG